MLVSQECTDTCTKYFMQDVSRKEKGSINSSSQVLHETLTNNAGVYHKHLINNTLEY